MRFGHWCSGFTGKVLQEQFLTRHILEDALGTLHQEADELVVVVDGGAHLLQRTTVA